jgi:hypothetical protein
VGGLHHRYTWQQIIQRIVQLCLEVVPHEAIGVWTVALKPNVICFCAAVLDQSALRDITALP